jgi:hypothetical protein
MKKQKFPIIALSIFLLASGCGGGGGGGGSSAGGGGGGGGDGGGGTVETTSISGQVTLSSSVAGKPAAKVSASSMAKGAPGSNRYYATKKSISSDVKVPAYAAGDVVSNASVLLYDSDHPEYLYPIAQSDTDDQGNYTLSVLSNAANNGDAYTDGDAIPKGNYTLMAFKPGGFDPVLGITTDPVVAVQTIVNEFNGAVTGTDLGAEPSDVRPTVEKMFGVSKNTDGTNTYGGTDVELAPNASIQVSFSMAMARGSITGGIDISPAADGYWSVSPDWLSATYYLNTGAQFTAGTTYTVTVQGGDTNSAAVKNVYGNALENTAVGTFTIPEGATGDTVSPTAVIASPVSSTDVDIITPIRITSNELMDVNKILLTSTPSLGTKPGVIYVGKDDSAEQYKYVYEFILADPLNVGTSYNITVSGGTDLAGNQMNALTYSFQTAATTAGVDSTADSATQSAQADVKDVFGKWIRAMNDRNLAQLQSMMTGNFAMEYDVGRHGADDQDVNRDGRYSLAEFSAMIKEAFTFWDYCGIAMSGDIPSNINVVGGKADFEFTLNATSDITSQECADAAPEDSLFALVTKINGSWLISRLGDGIDIRDKQLVVRDVIELVAPTHGSTVAATPSYTNGVVSDAVNFSWKPVNNVASYVFVIMNTRDDRLGRAFVMSSTPNAQDDNGNPIFELSLPFDKVNGESVLPFGVKAISGKFDFDTNEGMGMARDGEQFVWEVFGLGANTINDFEQGRASNLFRDIVAISKLNRYSNPGTFKEINVAVADVNSNAVSFSEIIDGYNAGMEDQLVLTITTPNGDAGNGSQCGPGCFDGAAVRVHGNTEQGYPLTFDANGMATVTIDLNQGMNWVEIWDGVDLGEGFNVQTEGGIPPVIAITSVVDDLGNSYTPDQWGFVSAPGSSSITIHGTVSDNAIVDLNVNLWNEELQANSFKQAQVSGGSFSVTMDIYQGHNWINIADNNWYYQAHVGVETDTGSTYVPPIVIDGVTDAVLTENYGNSANYDASNDADNIVTIMGSMAKPDINADVHYRHNSAGGYEEGTLNFTSTGAFTLEIELYNGWNGVDFEDGNGSWYGLQIFTSAGLSVPRPTIVSIDGNAVQMDDFGMVVLPNGQYETDQCSITVVGTSGMGAGSEVRASWNGFDGANNMSFWDEQKLVTDANDSFTVTLPLMSGNNNNIDINNEQWVWVGFPVNSTNANCAYTPPSMTVDAVTDSAGNALTQDPNSGDYDAGSNTTFAVSGTHSQVGRTVVASMWVCGSSVEYSTTVQQDNTWSIADITAYDGYNWVDVTDGPNWQSFGIMSNSGQQPPPPAMQVTSVTFDNNTGAMENYTGCDFADWSAPDATTVTVSGTTTAGTGTGNYFAGSQVGEFPIAEDGTFTFTVSLYDGFNNIGIDDTDWNHYGLNVQTANGLQAPQYIYIDNIDANGLVTGHIDTAQFDPNELWADVWYDDNGSGAFYHSNPINDDQPLMLNSDGTFSFQLQGTTGGMNIRVESCSGPVCHGHEIHMTDGNYDYENHWKAGSSNNSGHTVDTKAIDRVKAIKGVRSNH